MQTPPRPYKLYRRWAMTRAEEAQRLVDEGKVYVVFVGLYVTEGRVQGENARYTTALHTSGTFFCTCDWGQHHNYTHNLCAHALAVKLAVERKKSDAEVP